MNGTYTEKLKTGGEVQVMQNRWGIRYYFPGPDLRYNGTHVYLNGDEIEDYIEAWAKNYDDYLKLKETIPSGGTFQTKGLMDMTIHVGGHHDGVCIRDYYMPIRSKEKVDEVIKDYRYAQSCADRMMKMLNQN